MYYMSREMRHMEEKRGRTRARSMTCESRPQEEVKVKVLAAVLGAKVQKPVDYAWCQIFYFWCRTHDGNAPNEDGTR